MFNNCLIVVNEECVKNTRACSLYQMIDIRDVQHLAAQSTSNIHERVNIYIYIKYDNEKLKLKIILKYFRIQMLKCVIN